MCHLRNLDQSAVVQFFVITPSYKLNYLLGHFSSITISTNVPITVYFIIQFVTENFVMAEIKLILPVASFDRKKASKNQPRLFQLEEALSNHISDYLPDLEKN